MYELSLTTEGYIVTFQKRIFYIRRRYRRVFMAKIYDSEWAGHCIGRVENDGKVYDSEWAGHCIGRIESVPTKMGGAAYILLLR